MHTSMTCHSHHRHFAARHIIRLMLHYSPRCWICWGWVSSCHPVCTASSAREAACLDIFAYSATWCLWPCGHRCFLLFADRCFCPRRAWASSPTRRHDVYGTRPSIFSTERGCATFSRGDCSSKVAASRLWATLWLMRAAVYAHSLPTVTSPLPVYDYRLFGYSPTNAYANGIYHFSRKWTSPPPC